MLRYAFRWCRDRLRPGAQINDDGIRATVMSPTSSRRRYRYDHLARPVKIRPADTAAACPSISADFRVWTVKLKPGIHFADDPAFKGAEVARSGASWWRRTTSTALKRFYRPGWNVRARPVQSIAESLKADPGLSSELRAAGAGSKKPFDYDTRGRRHQARSTATRCSSRMGRSRSRASWPDRLADSVQMGAMAREVVEMPMPTMIMRAPRGHRPLQA